MGCAVSSELSATLQCVAVSHLQMGHRASKQVRTKSSAALTVHKPLGGTARSLQGWVGGGQGGSARVTNFIKVKVSTPAAQRSSAARRSASSAEFQVCCRSSQVHDEEVRVSNYAPELSHLMNDVVPRPGGRPAARG